MADFTKHTERRLEAIDILKWKGILYISPRRTLENGIACIENWQQLWYCAIMLSRFVIAGCFIWRFINCYAPVVPRLEFARGPLSKPRGCDKGAVMKKTAKQIATVSRMKSAAMAMSG